MIEVFQTNVNSPQQAERITALLRHSYPSAVITFDLEDCDRILRIAGVHTPHHVVATLESQGYDCQPLP
jgi:hypothetical protein